MAAPSAARTWSVALVKSGDQWKLDEIVEFSKFDEPQLIENLERELERNSGEVSTKFATCFVEAFSEGGRRARSKNCYSLRPPKSVEGVAKRCA